MSGKSTQQQIFGIIGALTGQSNILTIPRLFVDLTGDLGTALFLSQLVYWSDKGGRSDGFIYKSRAEWSEETALTEYAIRKATKALETMGILETKLLRANAAPTLHYRLDAAALVEALGYLVETNKSDLLKTQNRFVENDKSDLLNSTKHEQRLPIDHTEITDGGADAPAPIPPPKKRRPKKKTPPPPAVEAIRAGTNLYPPKQLWPGIVEVIGESQAEIDRAEKTALAWVACGYSPRNVKGILEHFVKNELPSTSKKGKTNGPATSNRRYSPTAEDYAASEEWKSDLITYSA